MDTHHRKGPAKVVIHHHSTYGRIGSCIRVKKQGSFTHDGDIETICFSPLIPSEFRMDLDFATINDLAKEIY